MLVPAVKILGLCFVIYQYSNYTLEIFLSSAVNTGSGISDIF